MRTITANGRVNKEGRLVISYDDRPVFLEQISRNAGKSCTIKVVIDGKRRSTEQNCYYWGVIVKMFQLALTDTWGEIMTAEEVHEQLKVWCNYRELVNDQTGETLKVGKTTASMSTVEFEEYEERCRQLAASFLGMTIPLPNEQLEIEF